MKIGEQKFLFLDFLYDFQFPIHFLHKNFFLFNYGHKRKSLLRIPQGGPYPDTSKTISRVLYLTVIYLDVLLPARSSHPGSGRANLYAPIPVLLRIEFTAMSSFQSSSELLPHFSTLTIAERWRYISVALFLKSPSAGVTRYPCPMEPGLSS